MAELMATLMAPGASLPLQVQKTVEHASKAKRDKAASTGQLLSYDERSYRPPRLACDLHRQSPLVMILQGTPPSKVLEGSELAAGGDACCSDEAPDRVADCRHR